MTEEALLALHREIVSIPSMSHQEKPLVDFLERFLRERGVEVQRAGDNLFAVIGQGGPLLAFNTHLDTVPASPRWTRDPHKPEVLEGKVYGLGSNDAKASVAAMIAAFLRLKARESELRCRLMLTLVVEEETGGKSGKGAELLLSELRNRGLLPTAVLVGEPTELELAVAQKGLLILELRAEGRACHAAHGRALGAPNAVRRLARDLMAIDRVDLGEPHPTLGPVTVEPTIVSGGTARNMIPAEASCFIDVRTNPKPDQSETAALLQAVVQSELKVVSERLRPYEIDARHVLVRAAQRARPQASLFGSRGLSDLCFFATAGVPALKVGPGKTERSHTPDEFVLESEIVDGAHFYLDAALAYGELASREFPASAGARPQAQAS